MVSRADIHHYFSEALVKSNMPWHHKIFSIQPPLPGAQGEACGVWNSLVVVDLGGDMRSQNGCENQGFHEDGLSLTHTPSSAPQPIQQGAHSTPPPMGWFLGHLGGAPHKDLFFQSPHPSVWLQGLIQSPFGTCVYQWLSLELVNIFLLNCFFSEKCF